VASRLDILNEYKETKVSAILGNTNQDRWPMPLTDEFLMMRLQCGDTEAFNVLYERYRRPLYNFILRFVQNEAQAEDVYQETFMRVLQAAVHYKQRYKFSTWLFTIAHNLCIDCLRADRSQIPLEEVEGCLTAPDSDPLDHLVQHELITDTNRALVELPPDQRAVVLLRVVHGYSQKETAQIVGASVGTVKSRLHYALLKLREILER
jgi:RNA polymerase sigma-70 factor (ECF subfamily)